MINFEYKGIEIDATVEMQPVNYMSSGSRQQTRFDREVRVYVSFWDFHIRDGCFHELAFVKSCLQCFIHSYRRRPNKEGSKIDFSQELLHENYIDGQHSLLFAARQKNKKYYLQICLKVEGETSNEVYLDAHETIMLDIALGKAISVLTPGTIG